MASNNNKRTCWLCGLRNHDTKDCKRESARCYKCGNFGHLSNCCEINEHTSICYKCHGTGHKRKDCTTSTDEQICMKCKKKGHIARQCLFYFKRNTIEDDTHQLTTTMEQQKKFIDQKIQLLLNEAEILKQEIDKLSYSNPQINTKILPACYCAPLKRAIAEHNICRICFYNVIDCVFYPCKHMGCCYYCFSKLKRNKCPFCGFTINEVSKFKS